MQNDPGTGDRDPGAPLTPEAFRRHLASLGIAAPEADLLAALPAARILRRKARAAGAAP